MQLTRPDFAQVLARAVTERPKADLGWLEAPPPRARVLRERVVLRPGTALDAVADALFGWRLHRGAGLVIASTGSAAAGATVLQDRVTRGYLATARDVRA